MLAILFTLFIGAALVMAAGSIIGTWQRYGASWDALSGEAARPAASRYMTIRVIQPRSAGVIAHVQTANVHDFKVKSLAVAQPLEWRAAA